jgi:hypothetical protein
MEKFRSIDELFLAWDEAHRSPAETRPEHPTDQAWLSFLQWLKGRGQGSDDLGMINANHQFPVLDTCLGQGLHLRLDETAQPNTALSKLQQLNKDYKLIEAAKAMLRNDDPELYSKVVGPVGTAGPIGT